jgi:hypothetical protein
VWLLSAGYQVQPPAAAGGEPAADQAEFWATLAGQPWWCWALGQAFHRLVCVRVNRGWADLLCHDLEGGGGSSWRPSGARTAARTRDRSRGRCPLVRGVEVMGGGGARRFEGDIET